MRNYIFPLYIMLLSSLAIAHVTPYISIRSQSQNAARELVLWQTQINLFEADEFNCSFNATIEYTRTFKPEELAKALFNDVLVRECMDSGCPRFLVEGSAVVGRDPRALLADYFGLPQDYSSTVRITPRISNILFDFNLFLGLDQWAEGLFFRVHAPVVRTEWDLGYCEKDIVCGNQNYPLGYFNGTVADPSDPANLQYGVARSQLVETFGNFVCGRQVPNIAGITFDPLANARMACRALKKTGLSEIEAGLGYNFARGDDYHVGVSIRAGFPTGNRPQGRWLFEPIVGNGHHWEIGFGFTSHWTPWCSFDGCDDLGLYVDINVFHLIKSRQWRTFDLCGKPLSRYMLACKMTAPAENLQDVQGNPPMFQFENEFSSVANISTLAVDVSVPLLADAVFKIAYTHKNFQFDLGYNFWGRTCEKIDTITECCTAEDTTWALKGDAFVYGFTALGGTGIPLSASESGATIACGTNNINRTDSLLWFTDPGVDNAKCAFNSAGNNIVNLVGGTPNNMFSSFDPIVFTTHDTTQWNIKGAMTGGMSQKLFMNLGYLWPECRDCYTPYLGIGAEVEFGAVDTHYHCSSPLCCVTGVPAVTNCLLEQKRDGFDGGCSDEHARGCDKPQCGNCCNNNNSSTCGTNNCGSCDGGCFNFTPSQWGVWLKAGVSYNT